MPGNRMIVHALAAGIAIAAFGGTAAAGPLENLERERALTVKTMVDPALSVEQRQEKLEMASRRLVDLERMAIRDQKTSTGNTPTVRVAFRNYDLTFLVHASVEKGVSMPDLWLEQVGVSTASLLGTRVGRRW